MKSMEDLIKFCAGVEGLTGFFDCVKGNGVVVGFGIGIGIVIPSLSTHIISGTSDLRRSSESYSPATQLRAGVTRRRVGAGSVGSSNP